MRSRRTGDVSVKDRVRKVVGSQPASPRPAHHEGDGGGLGPRLVELEPAGATLRELLAKDAGGLRVRRDGFRPFAISRTVEAGTRGGGPRVFGLHACVLSALQRVPVLRVHIPEARSAALLTAGALCLPLAACGEDDVDQAREDVEAKAEELQGDLDDLSEEDLRNELEEVEEAAENGSDDTKREARQLERKIERELNERK